MLNIAVADAAQMRALGGRLAAAIRAADVPGALVIGLSGELGAGKTTFVAGVLEAFGHPGPVRSPTYTLVEPYVLDGRHLYHCDLYRLRDPAEVEDLGLRELATDRSVLLIEWPERAGERLGSPDLALHIDYAPPGRRLAVAAPSVAGRRVADGLDLDPA